VSPDLQEVRCTNPTWNLTGSNPQDPRGVQRPFSVREQRTSRRPDGGLVTRLITMTRYQCRRRARRPRPAGPGTRVPDPNRPTDRFASPSQAECRPSSWRAAWPCRAPGSSLSSSASWCKTSAANRCDLWPDTYGALSTSGAVERLIHACRNAGIVAAVFDRYRGSVLTSAAATTSRRR